MQITKEQILDYKEFHDVLMFYLNKGHGLPVIDIDINLHRINLTDDGSISIRYSYGLKNDIVNRIISPVESPMTHGNLYKYIKVMIRDSKLNEIL